MHATYVYVIGLPQGLLAIEVKTALDGYVWVDNGCWSVGIGGLQGDNCAVGLGNHSITVYKGIIK